jgi:hypothetical protein
MAIENGPLIVDLPTLSLSIATLIYLLKVAIFRSFVSLPVREK